MASSPAQLASGKVVSNPDASVERKVDTRPPKLEIFAQEKCEVPQGMEPIAEADSGVGLGMTLKNVVSAFPLAASQRCGDVEPETQVRPANLRTFLSPSLKSLTFYSPTPEASPLSAEFVLGKSNTICNGLMDKIQQYPSRTPVQAAKGGRFFFTKYMDAMESMIMAEPVPSMSFLDCTMESSCLELEADAMNLPQIRSPQVQSCLKVTLGVEESAIKSAAGAADASVESCDMNCFRSQQNLITNLEKEQLSKSSANVDIPSTSVLNGTYNLSNCEKSSGGQDLLVAETGSIAMESGSFTKAGRIVVEAPSEVGLTVKGGSLNETSSNNTLVLHTGPSVTGCNLTVDITDRSVVGPATEASVAHVQRENSKDALELHSETTARPSVTVDLCHANLRSFLSPSLKYLSFLSPIPEVSPVSAELVLSKSNSIHGNAMDENQQYPSRTPLQAVKGGKWFLTKCMDAMESMIMAEPAPSMSFLDCTMESSVLKLEGDAVNKPESRLPQLRSHEKVTPGLEESAEKSGARGADASVESRDANSCFGSQQNLGSINLEKKRVLKSSANVEVPSSPVLNGTYNLSSSEKSSRGQDLLVAEAGNTTVEVASVADPTANQASSNNTLVLHAGHSVTGRNLTIDITDRSTVGPTTEASVAQMLRENSKETVELQSGTMARPNVTVDITDRSGFGVSLQDSAGSLGRKNGTFEIDLDSAHEPTKAPNLTVNLTSTNVSGPKTGDLQPCQSNEPATGQKLTCCTSKQLDFEDDLAGVSEFEAGADGMLAPFTEAGNCDGDCNQNMCMEDPEGYSQMSFDTSLDMKPNFLITSTPLVAPKVFSFAAKAAPSDSCSMRSVLGRCEASSNGNEGSTAQVDQPPPASARPPMKSLAIPTSLPLKCSAITRPSNRKTLAFPSAIPKSHHTISRPPSSLLAPPPRTLSGLQVPGTSFLQSSTQSRIGRRTGGVTRNTTASNPLEASVGSTINRRRQSVSENKPPIPGLLKPPIPSQPSASSVISQLALRPSGQAKPKLLTHRAAASSASRGSSESHMKGTQLPASSAKQPRGNTEETQPLCKRKRVDTLVHPGPSQSSGPPAGNQKSIRKPASLLRAPQSRLQSLGDQTSGILATKKSAPPAPLPPDLQPAAAQTDCKNCAKYRLEIARLRAELQEKGQMNS